MSRTNRPSAAPAPATNQPNPNAPAPGADQPDPNADVRDAAASQGPNADETDREDERESERPDPPQARRQAAKAKPAAPARAKLEADKVVAMRHGVPSPAALALLAEACSIFGINPERGLKRPEIVAWEFTPANRDLETEAAVKIVTAGGVKIVYPITPETEEILRRVFHAFRIDPKTRETIPQPLPADLTLPPSAVDGHPRDLRRGGFLRRGAGE